ncbi:hypothetical protein T10_12451 [Trichinella papuae]|uniref:Integrase catalytic domain-containing protein n=1 Tax=Trichinella papuae TaxID=268474 RepID=A0A0V1N7J2_9BILA|nr:hypothetical protein T10_12451 [Trichinella papuae]
MRIKKLHSSNFKKATLTNSLRLSLKIRICYRIETIFGWIVCGPTTRQAVDREETTLLAQTEDRLSRLLRRFWEVEALGILPSTEDANSEPALTRFEESVSFDGQRYSVGLLWKAGASPLPKNLEMAKRRLRSLRHRLAWDPEKEREYADVIQSYLDQGWAEEVPDESGPIGKTWYLPHHAVYQGGPGKAKCRVVFDGSAEMNGASLNRCLEHGPKLQPDLVAILLRFRRSRIGIQADIEKMYLQIGLRPEDRDVCRFLWQAAGSKSPARIYRLTRVGFGLSSSPFLAMRVIRHHAQSHGKVKALADKVLSDMYVDDLATSCDRIEEAQTLIRQLCNLMKSGGFAMKKWASNDPAALSDLPVEVTSPLETSRLWKTLGLYWNRRLDVLTFVPPAGIHLGRHDTKRQLALWLTGIEWDDPLPAEINGKWISWKDELERLSVIHATFVDMEGLLRVGGRLTNAALPWCHKHPLLLPPDGTIVALIVRRAHESELHAGVNQTLAALRQRYWVIRGRQAVKRCIRSCITCRRQDGRPFCPLMSELPVARVEPTFPFGHVGLDFAGPLHVRDEDRGVRKVYICLFTCMVTRAVHIEIVANMTTTSFLAAFRRFVASRGTPEVIQSDNFRTFKQADAFIRSFFVGKRAEQFRNELVCRCIQWRYTTERAPWSGGYWERLVRSVKNVLRKVLGRSLLRFDELRITLCEFQARINNRPLTLLSEDPKDCAPLTPAHFLIGRELAALPTSSRETPSRTGAKHLRRRWWHQKCCKFSLQSDRQVRPAIFDMTGDPKMEVADLAQAS